MSWMGNRSTELPLCDGYCDKIWRLSRWRREIPPESSVWFSCGITGQAVFHSPSSRLWWRWNREDRARALVSPAKSRWPHLSWMLKHRGRQQLGGVEGKEDLGKMKGVVVKEKWKRTWTFRKQPSHLAAVLKKWEISKDKAEHIFHSHILQFRKLSSWLLCHMATVWPHPFVLSLEEAEAAIVNWFHISGVTPVPVAGPRGLPSGLCFHGRPQAPHWSFCRKQPPPEPSHSPVSSAPVWGPRLITLSWPKGRGETSPEILLKWFKPLEAQPSESWQINCAHRPQWHLLQIISIQVGFVKVLRPCVLQSCLHFSFLSFFFPTNIIKRWASDSWSHVGKLVHEQNSNNK